MGNKRNLKKSDISGLEKRLGDGLSEDHNSIYDRMDMEYILEVDYQGVL